MPNRPRGDRPEHTPCPHFKAGEDVQQERKKTCQTAQESGFRGNGLTPLEDLLYKHYAKIELGASEQEGHGTSKTKNMGRQLCLNSAMAEYASKEVSQIQGRTFYDAQGNEIDPTGDENFARFYVAFERLTQKEIKGELQESFTVMKQNPDGSYEFTMYMTYDPKKASDRREQALKEAFTESGLAQQYGIQGSDYINKK